MRTPNTLHVDVHFLTSLSTDRRPLVRCHVGVGALNVVVKLVLAV